MLIIVRAKPILFTMVRPVATSPESDEWATRAENCGLSDTTNKPQVIRRLRKRKRGVKNPSGIKRQQSPDPNNDTIETHLLPIRDERCPPTAQLTPPTPIITKLQSDTDNWIPELLVKYRFNMTGTNAQNV